MDPEEKELLEKAVALSEENNTILRKMKRTAQLALGLRLFYWVFIIGAAIGAFYFIQPYIDAIGGTASGFKGNIDTLKSLVN